MKILAFADLHANREAATRIAHQLKTVDWGVCLGDLSYFRRGFRELVDILDVGTNLYVVPGNHDLEEEVQHCCSERPNFHSFHGRYFSLGGYSFAGLGGAIVDEKSITRMVRVFRAGWQAFIITEGKAHAILETFKGLPNLILFTHNPPYDTTVDLARGDRHIGSHALRQFILDTQPKSVYSAHVHEAAGNHDVLGTTQLVAVGQQGILINLK